MFPLRSGFLARMPFSSKWRAPIGVRKVAAIFIAAVFVPSLVLAWLALRSLQNQQLILERQQFLLYQNTADALARDVAGFMQSRVADFAAAVEQWLGTEPPAAAAPRFDEG